MKKKVRRIFTLTPEQDDKFLKDAVKSRISRKVNGKVVPNIQHYIISKLFNNENTK